MGGVVAGSAIANYSECSKTLRLIALTVNNKCNLTCPHCYLKYHGPSGYISERLQTILLAQSFDHLAIVGMEPFVSRDATGRTIELASRAKSVGKTVSAITNGLGLRYLDASAAELFDFVDVSFDGGLETYSEHRGGSLKQLLQSLNHVQRYNLRLSALHTLYKQNLGDIDDMMTVFRFYDFGKVIFSPYVETLSEGTNEVDRIAVFDILHALSKSRAFLDEAKAYLLLDRYHLNSEGIPMISAKAEAARQSLIEKVHFVPYTPLQIGSMRVTYDGLIMPPATALHTSLYRQNHWRLERTSIATAYNESLKQEQAQATERDYAVAVG
jgi:MoaA/NifB/PqqE/SkfB family radical SAM enzyme